MSKYTTDLPCLACGVPGPNDLDHITTRGAGGKDEDSNLWPLCRAHHVIRHAQGLSYMIKTFPKCKHWLIEHGREDILTRKRA